MYIYVEGGVAARCCRLEIKYVGCNFVVRIRISVHVRRLGDEFGLVLSNNLKDTLMTLGP